MQALCLYAGPAARERIARHGLTSADIAAIPGAAGGPKGLILGPLDRFIFGDWLRRSRQPVDLVGASIGAWRMATACLDDPVAAFTRLEQDYIHQHLEPEAGRRLPSAARVTDSFARNLQLFFGGQEATLLAHPRFRLHVLASRGRHLLGREHRVATPLGYLGAYLSNGLSRKALGAWLERVIFSARADGGRGAPWPLPFGTQDFRSRQVALTAENFQAALRASCSIPFALQAVHQIPGAPPGAYWDGGITDYHLHLDYSAALSGAGGDGSAAPSADSDAQIPAPRASIVLYPHFQRAVVPGWLDKAWKWRHAASHHLDHVLLLAPNPAWVQRLPGAKLPDRNDFVRYARDYPGRVKAWAQAAAESQRLADEFALWLDKPDMTLVKSL
jgi:hypothetical protein